MAKLHVNGDKTLIKLVRNEIHPEKAKVDTSETVVVITSSGRILERWIGKVNPGSNKKPINTGWRLIDQVRLGPKTLRKVTRSWCGKGFRVISKQKA